MKGEFSVCEFYEDGSYEYLERFVDDETAFDLFARCAELRAAGVTRLIITDEGDRINAEWKAGVGFTFPPELVKAQKYLVEEGGTA